MGTIIPPPVDVNMRLTNLYAGDEDGLALENTLTPVFLIFHYFQIILMMYI